MAGRGGRGARGGRGGRWSGRGGPANQFQDLIRDNLEDLGMDAFQQLDDRNPQPLFPMVPIPVPADIKDNDIYLMTKARDISSRQVLDTTKYCAQCFGYFPD